MADKHQKIVLIIAKVLKGKFQFPTCELKMRERERERGQWLQWFGSYAISRFKLKLSL